MSVRPLKNIKLSEMDPLAAALQQEINNEKASTLSRLNKKLQQTLDRLRELDADSEASEELLNQRTAEAGEALWHVTIQRELCGLLRHKEFYDHMGVPKSVRLNMGPRPSRKPK